MNTPMHVTKWNTIHWKIVFELRRLSKRIVLQMLVRLADALGPSWCFHRTSRQLGFWSCDWLPVSSRITLCGFSLLSSLVYVMTAPAYLWHDHYQFNLSWEVAHWTSEDKLDFCEGLLGEAQPHKNFQNTKL